MLKLQELILLILVIGVLTSTGLWPTIIRAIRELRGERVNAAPETPTNVDICFKMLGISPSASWDEIESAYRQKAKIHHPDHGGDGDAMRALNEAYAQIKRSRGVS
jgi:hypothetical protein